MGSVKPGLTNPASVSDTDTMSEHVLLLSMEASSRTWPLSSFRISPRCGVRPHEPDTDTASSSDQAPSSAWMYAALVGT
jgi:hypothetical protein